MASASHEFSAHALQAQIRGFIEGVHYVAAETNGAGACGLHAVFGMPRHGSGVLEFADARRSVISQIPESIDDVYSLYGGTPRTLQIIIPSSTHNNPHLHHSTCILLTSQHFFVSYPQNQSNPFKFTLTVIVKCKTHSIY